MTAVVLMLLMAGMLYITISGDVNGELVGQTVKTGVRRHPDNVREVGVYNMPSLTDPHIHQDICHQPGVMPSFKL